MAEAQVKPPEIKMVSVTITDTDGFKLAMTRMEVKSQDDSENSVNYQVFACDANLNKQRDIQIDEREGKQLFILLEKLIIQHRVSLVAMLDTEGEEELFVDIQSGTADQKRSARLWVSESDKSFRNIKRVINKYKQKSGDKGA